MINITKDFEPEPTRNATIKFYGMTQLELVALLDKLDEVAHDLLNINMSIEDLGDD